MSSQKKKAYIVGVGLTKFVKPQKSNDYVEMGYEAGIKALLDAHITYDDVDRAIACYCYGDSTCGQRVLYQFGMTRIPIYNVNNNCCTGSTGIAMANEFVCSGLSDCVMVVGFEKMAPGSLGSHFSDRTDPLDTAKNINKRTSPEDSTAPFAAQMFGNAAREYIEKYGATGRDFEEVARVNHAHSRYNPYAQFCQQYSTEEVAASSLIHWPLTKLQCCPTSDGAAAAIVVSYSFLQKHPALQAQAVEIAGQCLVTDSPRSYSGTAMDLVGYDMTQHAVSQALAEAELSVENVKLVELHDCFSANEILAIDALGLSAPGKAHEYIRNAQATYGSKAAVVNPSGGLISKGHPLGATGIAQCAELVWQLRGWANNRHVNVGAGQAALQHNAALGGAAVVTLLRRMDGQRNQILKDSSVAKINDLGYNPAVEARGYTVEHAEEVKAKRTSPWMEASRSTREKNTQVQLA